MAAEDPTAGEVQRELAELLRTHADPSLWYFRHPLTTCRMLLMMRRLPVIRYQPTGQGFQSELVSRAMPPSRIARFTVLKEARHVLTLPTDGTPYNAGPARATQRRKARAATKLGVTTRLITDDDEKRALLKASEDYLSVHPQEHYRVLDPENRDMMEVDLWMAAFHEDEPIILSITPVDGDFATLKYFRTMTHTDASSAARYLLTEHLAEELARRNARYLVDMVNPSRLPRGLFHFAQMVGYRVLRIRVIRTPSGGTAGLAPKGVAGAAG